MAVYEDIDIWGNENGDGSPVLYYDESALKNALVQWMISERGEYLMNPDMGGILKEFEFKNMSGDKLRLFIFRLKNAILEQFFPRIEILDINTDLNYNERITKIDVYYLNLSSGVKETATVFIANDTKNIKYVYIEVIETGDQLRDWCLVKKDSMEGKKLIYDFDQSSWRWGKYKFINFSESSPNFAEVLAICNVE